MWGLKKNKLHVTEWETHYTTVGGMVVRELPLGANYFLDGYSLRKRNLRKTRKHPVHVLLLLLECTMRTWQAAEAEAAAVEWGDQSQHA